MNADTDNKIRDRVNATMAKLDFNAGYQIRYKRLGTSIGQYSPRTNTLTFDPLYIDQYLIEYLGVIVPHETCHMVKHLKYHVKEKAHGRIWQHLMRGVGLNPDRCNGTFEIVPLRQVRKVTWHCSCREWPFTIRRVNKDRTFRAELAAKGKPVRPRYRCPLCKVGITRTGEEN